MLEVLFSTKEGAKWKKNEDIRNEYIKKFDGYFPNMGLSEDKEVEIIEKCLKEERKERKKIKKFSVRDNVNIAYKWNKKCT